MTYGSLFSGCEGFGQGFDRVGMSCAWQVEIDKNAIAVLEKRYPKVQRFKDVRKVGIHNLPAVDVLCGGSPCQDLSVAGRRAGLGGERSGLFFEFCRVARELDPTFVVFENVPGLLSSNDGRDFAVALGGLSGLVPSVPDAGWGNAGVCVGPFGVASYRVLDARWFGVPQRRRRVFVVVSARDASSVPVLFEPESLRRDTAPGAEEGAQVAATIESRARGGGFPGTDGACGGHIVAHSLRSEGHDASEDGTGRGTPVIAIQERAVCENPDAGPDGKGWNDSGIGYTLEARHHVQAVAFDTTQVTSKGNRSNPKPGDPCHPLASQAHPPAVVFAWNKSQSQSLRVDVTTDALQASPTSNPAVCVRTAQTSANGHGIAEDAAHTLDGANAQAVPVGYVVRRLTPRECEKLQDWEPDWTRYRADGSEISDSARYRLIGNGVVASVSEWIGRRIVRAFEAEGRGC